MSSGDLPRTAERRLPRVAHSSTSRQPLALELEVLIGEPALFRTPVDKNGEGMSVPK